MFGKKESDRPTTVRGGGEKDLSIIGPGMRIQGDIVTEGTVRVEGRIEGTLRAGAALILAKGGEVVGDIVTRDAVIGGTVRGTVTAEGKLELQTTSLIEGEICAASEQLKLEEGARFNGMVRMLEHNGQREKALQPQKALPAGNGE
jgi:cytoskeletal protein CcmA (bactofilin family)